MTTKTTFITSSLKIKFLSEIIIIRIAVLFYQYLPIALFYEPHCKILNYIYQIIRLITLGDSLDFETISRRIKVAPEITCTEQFKNIFIIINDETF